ncbi:hypothetical protein FEAC_28020 [Ferrimicrobium acidiphilum DSM 19497]|uniref:Uncharacterized protein n=1 Tax=Ferrimicrobium acidiphilum DSM 19497 TaxID=1121877 RepID=A0A0D8FT88_9ACTN|nr:hypothetical protein FEAC_28020 [Ferrimicrobium acidiphilum DSM 19497]
MTRCPSLRCQSLILWLDSYEAHGTPSHVVTQHLCLLALIELFFNPRTH